MTLRSDRPGTTDVVLTLEDQVRIRRAMFAMPYAADTRVPLPPHPSPATGPLEGEAIAAFLEGLAVALRDHGETATRHANDLRDLRHDVAAMRRVLGTGE